MNNTKPTLDQQTRIHQLITETMHYIQRNDETRARIAARQLGIAVMQREGLTVDQDDMGDHNDQHYQAR